jgi:Endonuclease/Exonuclease/phosphatase family
VRVRALSWNLFHGRDFPPDPALFTWRSRLLRITERNATHLQVNGDLFDDFAAAIAGADWDVALLQECPPRWAGPLADECAADAHRTLTSRNSFGALRTLLARLNPDLIGSNEGGSNLTLVRRRFDEIADRRELVLSPGPDPERRTMAFTTLGSGQCVANLHASTGDAAAADELRAAARRCLEWAGAAVILGGDFNVRPRQSDVFGELAELGFSLPADPDAIDHLLGAALEVAEPAAAWPPGRREAHREGLAIRLSDHAPIEATFAA